MDYAYRVASKWVPSLPVAVPTFEANLPVRRAKRSYFGGSSDALFAGERTARADTEGGHTLPATFAKAARFAPRMKASQGARPERGFQTLGSCFSERLLLKLLQMVNKPVEIAAKRLVEQGRRRDRHANDLGSRA